MNKIEEYKKEKDGLDVLPDVPRYAAEGWEAITDGDRERLKWTGVFFRKQTPGHFMMRIRIPNGISNAAQLRTIAEISRDYGKGFADITTRQQMQLRWFAIEDVPEFWERLRVVGLVSLQTGMDNIRNAADFVEVISRRGKAMVQVRVTAEIRPGTCFMPFHWGRQFGFYKAANNLTVTARDPVSRQPELKACAVRVRKVLDFPGSEP